MGVMSDALEKSLKKYSLFGVRKTVDMFYSNAVDCMTLKYFFFILEQILPFLFIFLFWLEKTIL